MKKVLIVFLVAGMAVTSQAQRKGMDTIPNLPDHYRMRVEKFKKETIIPGKIIFLGNSITEGGNWKRLLSDSTIVNRGISGDNTFGILARIDDVVKRQPEKVFLLIGTNDLSKKIPVEVILENIFSIVSKIRAASPKTKIFVQSILPVNASVEKFPSRYDNDSEILIINDQLSRYAERLRYTYVDLYGKFLDEKSRLKAGYTYDGLHLNSAGYQHWVEILKNLKHL